jgi:hypothetical protein
MDFSAGSASSKGWHVQWEVSPIGAGVRNPVAWVASVEETKRMEPTDKAILGMASESPGRNESELNGGLDKKRIRRPRPFLRDEGSMRCCSLTDAAAHSGGVVRGSTVTRACRATGETVLVPLGNRWSKVGRITGSTGKAVEGETAAARSVVARKRGNARGAKGPCCTWRLSQQGRQG